MKQKIVVDSKINFLSFYSGLHNEFEFILDETLQTNADLYVINIWDSNLLNTIDNIKSKILLVDNEGEDWNYKERIKYIEPLIKENIYFISARNFLNENKNILQNLKYLNLFYYFHRINDGFYFHPPLPDFKLDNKKYDFISYLGLQNNNTDYQFFLGSHPEVSGTNCLDGSGTPLLRGDLQELKLAVGTNEIHNYGTLQVSGDISPTTSRVSDLGNVNRAWRSINGMLIFPDPNNVKSNGNIIPCFDGLTLGTPDLRWDGFFRDVNIDGNLTVGGETICGSGSGIRFREGFFDEDIAAPISFCSPTSGLFREYHTCEGTCESGNLYYVINRDTNLSITSGTYGQVLKHGEEWRPIWVSCGLP